SGSLLFLKMLKLIAIAHMRRASGPAGCGRARWLASASSFFLRSAASVALATAFSIAKVMLGPLEVCAMLCAMKFPLLPEPVEAHVPEGRHDVPGNRPGLAVDDRHRRHVRGWLAHLALDLLREAAEVEQLAHPGEACRRARLELADVGRVLVLDGRHVLRL